MASVDATTVGLYTVEGNSLPGLVRATSVGLYVVEGMSISDYLQAATVGLYIVEGPLSTPPVGVERRRRFASLPG